MRGVKMENNTVFLSNTKTGMISPRIIGEGEGPILLFLHDMKDCSQRYQYFAEEMKKKGMTTVLFDLPGHGKAVVDPDYFGYFGDHREVDIVKDIRELIERLKNRYVKNPFFLIGQGFGSSLIRLYIALDSVGIDGVVLSGIEGPNFFSKGIIKIMEEVIKEEGDFYQNQQVDDFLFNHYNKKIEDPITSFDWISRDKNTVKEYIENPLCGFVPTMSGILTHFTLIREVNSNNWFREVADIPMLILSGSHDPVGDYGKGALEVLNRLKKEEKKNSDGIIYRNCRHDLFNELNKDNIYEDIYQWIDEILEKKKKTL